MDDLTDRIRFYHWDACQLDDATWIPLRKEERMTFREVSNRIKENVQRTEIDIEEMTERLNTSPSTMRQLIKGNSTMMYVFLDFIEEIGLELRLNDQVITCHQDMLDYAKSVQPSRKPTVIPESTTRRFFAGENVQIARVFRILDEMGIEVRIV
jgi:hypothetical protein